MRGKVVIQRAPACRQARSRSLQSGDWRLSQSASVRSKVLPACTGSGRGEVASDRIASSGKRAATARTSKATGGSPTIIRQENPGSKVRVMAKKE